MPRYEILSEDAMDVLDRGWRRIVSELGIEFLLPEAVELFRGAGQIVEDENRVRFDPEFILEQVAKAPREFELQARNPDNTAHIGGDHMVFAPVYGCPFIREGDVRRDAKMADFENLVRLAQAFPELDSPGGTICEPEDRPLDSRHLDMVYALQTLSDKPYMGSVTSGPNAADTIRMGEILFGGREAIERAPASISLINVNSPLRYDDRMLGGDVRVREGQPGRRDHAVPADGGDVAGLAARRRSSSRWPRALAGIALAQLIRPGAPVVFGSFLSNTDMQSGSPSFGTPESGIGVLCTGQIARRFGLPWRGGGALNASQTVDAQAAYESLMTFLPTFLAGRQLRHALGRLARGRPRLLLREVHRRRRAAARAAPRVHAARDRRGEPRVRRPHRGRRRRPLPRRRPHARPLPRVLLPAAAVLDRELRSLDQAAARGTRPRAPARSGARRSRSYEQPPLDDAIRAELEEFVVRRRAELGD